MLKKKYLKSRDVTKITFELADNELPGDLDVKSVHIVGEFNDWDTEANPMKYLKKGSFQTTLELEPGRAYQFRYLVNGAHWCNDWNADNYVPGGHGSDNCIVVTPDINFTEN